MCPRYTYIYEELFALQEKKNRRKKPENGSFTFKKNVVVVVLGKFLRRIEENLFSLVYL